MKLFAFLSQEQEARTELLRKKAKSRLPIGGSDVADTEIKHVSSEVEVPTHINFFSEIEKEEVS